MPTTPAICGIADAVVTALNGGTFETSFTATRVYLPQKDLKDLTALAVEVVPIVDAGAVSTRNQTEHQYQVNIGIRKKVANTNNATLDPLVYLCEQIASFFLTHAISGRNEKWIGCKSENTYDPNALDSHSVFQAVLQLTFRGFRS